MKADNIIRKFTLFGVLFGFCFPLMSLTIDLIDKSLGFNLEDIIKIHEITPIHYIVDLAPLILGGTSFFIGKFISKIEASNRGEVEQELEKSKKYADYISHLINGNFNFDINFGEGGEKLVESLNLLRNNLLDNEKREERQLWTSNGLAKFIEVLRTDQISLKELSNRIISNLVQYVNANQGGIYLSKENRNKETILELSAAYAFEKQKFIEDAIKPGQGLVGQAFIEKETIFLKEVPSDYIKITSGLGKTNPTCILLVPLVINGQIHGILELASFKIFEDFQIEFIEKLSENIAATISNIKTSEMTTTLLQESQYQTEQMRSQEEEMRQNMEELAATQEDMERKEHEYQKRIKDLEAELSASK